MKTWEWLAVCGLGYVVINAMKDKPAPKAVPIRRQSVSQLPATNADRWSWERTRWTPGQDIPDPSQNPLAPLVSNGGGFAAAKKPFIGHEIVMDHKEEQLLALNGGPIDVIGEYPSDPYPAAALNERTEEPPPPPKGWKYSAQGSLLKIGDM